MKYIRGYQSHKSYRVNEEFVAKLTQGPLSNLLQAFASPFKTINDDVKRSFKENDPDSIKNILISNLNKALSAAQKEIRNLKMPLPNSSQQNSKDSDIESIMDGFISTLTDLANNIGKDFSQSIENKNQASASNELSKAILLGNKEAGWEGVVGLLNDPNYAYSKPKYDDALLAASGQKTGIDLFKAKQDASYSFFDNFQKDIVIQISKNFTEEEMKKLYNEAVKKGGGITITFDYDKILDFKNKKINVKYKLKGYNENKPPEDQPSEIGEKQISEIDKGRQIVTFEGTDGSKIEKKFTDILGPSTPEDKSNINKDVTNNLKDISKDPKNIELIKNVTDAIKSNPNIVSKIQSVLPNE